MKSIFFVGKGGVGKSTLSATAAWQLSRAGHRVFAISFDPAHNLGDIFGLSLSDAKATVDANLDLAEADLDRAAERYIQKNVDILNQMYSYTKAFNLDLYFKVLRYSPGVEEYAALTVLEEVFRTETDYDYVVFDTPPTALTLRILALPNIAVTWIDRLRRIRREILRKRYTIHNLSGKYIEGGVQLPYKEEDDEVIRQLSRLFKQYVDLYARLRGGDNSIAVVFNPDFLSRRESERIITGLNDLKLPLRAAFDNKFTREMSAAADEVENSLFGAERSIPVVRVPFNGSGKEDTYRMDFDITAALTGQETHTWTDQA
ncbi:ArsA family ATPase [Salinispira pacifica]